MDKDKTSTQLDMNAVRRKNLRALIKEQGMTIADFSRIAGITEARLAQVLSDKYRDGKNFGEKAARTIEKAASLPPLCLDKVDDVNSSNVVHLRGNLETIAKVQSKFDKNVTHAPIGRRAIPVISAIQAGALKEIAEPYEPGDGSETIYTDDEYSRWAFALVIEGDSMLPEFKPGDQVIIEPEWEPRPGEYVAAKNGREEATFKKYRQRGTDAAGGPVFELVPLNEDYPTMRSDEQQLTIIGVMAEHRRKTRRR